MNSRSFAACAAALILAGVAANAQTTAQTTYLLDNYVYGYRFNPAFVPEKSFFGIGVGNVNPAVRSQIGLSNVLFPTENGLVTGLNSSVSSEQFLGKLRKDNNVSVNINESILNIGFRGAKGGFSTIELNLRADVALSLPYEIFSFLKDAGEPSYDLSSLYGGAQAYMELAYGYSRNIGDKLSIGARAKFLCGLARVDVDIDKALIHSDSEQILVSADATISAAAPYLDFGMRESEYDPSGDEVLDFEALQFDAKKIRPSGYGAAIDLGAIYRPTDDLDISLAINDIGGLWWNYSLVGRTDADATFEGERFLADEEESEEGEEESEFQSEFSAAMQTLESLAEFHREDGKGGFRFMPFSVNLGVRYRLPMYRNFAVGATAIYKYSPHTSWWDVRGGTAITPVPWFSFTCNAGYSSFGPVCGAGLSINAGPLNLFAAVDGYIGKIALATTPKASIPYPVNKFAYNANVGFDIIFGHRVRTYKAPAKKVKESKRKGNSEI